MPKLTGKELLQKLSGMTESQLELPVVSSDDVNDGFNFWVGDVYVGNVSAGEYGDDEEGPLIIIAPDY